MALAHPSRHVRASSAITHQTCKVHGPLHTALTAQHTDTHIYLSARASQALPRASTEPRVCPRKDGRCARARAHAVPPWVRSAQTDRRAFAPPRHAAGCLRPGADRVAVEQEPDEAPRRARASSASRAVRRPAAGASRHRAAALVGKAPTTAGEQCTPCASATGASIVGAARLRGARHLGCRRRSTGVGLPER